jgi:two-component system sensor histidine kinase DegS
LQYFEELLGRLLKLFQGAALDMPMTAGQISGGQPSPSEPAHPSTPTIVRIVEAQETERQRLARQMHDGPAQSLTNFILQAEICQRLFERNPDRAAEELDQLKVAASSTFQKVRDFIFDLRPMMLDDLGLVPTMRRYVEAYHEKTNIDTQLNIVGEERRLPSHIEVMMFRSVQQLMANARDSLNAKSVTISLDVGPMRVKSTIENDGREFDSEHALVDGSGENVLGLRTLKERIELLGGTFEATSSEDLNRFVIILPASEMS